jgi:hypothetical protein
LAFQHFKFASDSKQADYFDNVCVTGVVRVRLQVTEMRFEAETRREKHGQGGGKEEIHGLRGWRAEEAESAEEEIPGVRGAYEFIFLTIATSNSAAMT